MFRRCINQLHFALIKANKPRKDTELSARSIDDCRHLLGMPKCEKIDVAQKAKNYIKERGEWLGEKQTAGEIYKQWSRFKPLECQINILSTASKMDAEQCIYLYRVFDFWGSFLLKEQGKLKSGSSQDKDSYKAMLVEYSNALNNACYLLNLDEHMILLYLRIFMLVQSLRSEDKNASHLRYILDNLLKLKKVKVDSLDFLLVFTARFLMQSVYHQKEDAIRNFIYGNLPNLSKEKRYNKRMVINLLHNISLQNEISKEMKTLTIHIYKTHSDVYVKLRAFTTLTEIFEIDKNNIQNEQHLKNLNAFIKQYPSQAFKYLSKRFLRADIWIKDFWVPYFEYVNSGDNYKEIENLSHHIVDDLLAGSKVGGEELAKAALKFRQTLKRKNIEIQKVDVRRQYERTFGRIKENKNSCQLHVANSMRLICGAQILTEVPIKYFLVDVLVDKSIVVEINNTNHYKIIDGVVHFNLKTQFRERILTQNGYKCYTIKVDDLSSSNFNMLEQIYKIVESSENMRKISKSQPTP